MKKMKPIKLEVKGLNSFIDKQVVEFDKLTERGLLVFLDLLEVENLQF